MTSDRAAAAVAVEAAPAEGAPGIGEAELAAAIEAILFSTDRPVTAAQISATIRAEGRSVNANQIRAAIRQLTAHYAVPERAWGRGFELVEVAAGYTLRTVPEYANYARRFAADKPQRLSRAALEALAVVAYRQPVTRPQIDEVRGVDSSSAVKLLLDRHLVKVLGKSDEVGRPLLYGTTPEFLELFGLRSLGHLPTLQEFQELTDENRTKVEALHPRQAEVRITDLAVERGQLVTTETEQASQSALSDLESAVKTADLARREAVATLGPEAAADVPADTAAGPGDPDHPEDGVDAVDPQLEAELDAAAEGFADGGAETEADENDGEPSGDAN
ncbi:MAG: SMC-Scp complex subunit ScpB [Deltaproteobacteria bacterium]|nr:SMC-Scp complex subunit ScpB [Deltaproteobacteria bacterium]